MEPRTCSALSQTWSDACTREPRAWSDWSPGLALSHAEAGGRYQSDRCAAPPPCDRFDRGWCARPATGGLRRAPRPVSW